MPLVAFARILMVLTVIVLPSRMALAAREPVTHAPVILGLDGELGLANSISAESIERGIRTVIDEINRAGAIRNIREMAAVPDLVAVFGGRFSPVVIEESPVLEETRTLFLAPWSSADAIVENGMRPPIAPPCAPRWNVSRATRASPKLSTVPSRRTATRRSPGRSF